MSQVYSDIREVAVLSNHLASENTEISQIALRSFFCETVLIIPTLSVNEKYIIGSWCFKCAH